MSKNTLFAYFSRKSANGTPKNNEKKSSPPTTNIKAKRKSESVFQIGEVVWAKLQGYPSWPSIVCEDPVEKIHCRSGTSPEIHVQFFDEPPTRAWIKESLIDRFNASDKGISDIGDSKLQRACDDAIKAMKLSLEERLSNLPQCKTSAENKDESFELRELDDSDEECETSKRKAPKRKDENLPLGSTKKRRRIVIVSDGEDSDEEYKPDKNAKESEESASGDEEMSISEGESDSDAPIMSKLKRRSKNKSKKNPKKAIKVRPTPFSSLENTPAKDTEKTKAKLSPFLPKQSQNSVDDGACGSGKMWVHLTYDFLKEDKIRDANMRLKSDPNYDPKTLHIPDAMMKKFSPAMRQWWEMKSQRFDVILFFKVGKFYEFYHMDAVIGVNELNLVYMKGEYAHSGFPEIAYGRYSASLVERGYRVARVEQTETPAMMEERCKKSSRSTKYDRVVNREICQITTKGTRCYGVLDSQNVEADATYLLAVTELSHESESGNESEYGVCFIDTSIGKFHIGQFIDDRHGSRLQTLTSYYVPVQVLYEKGTLSAKTLQIFKNLNGALLDSLYPNKEFWSAEKTLKFLAEGNYFESGGDAGRTSSGNCYPEVLGDMLDCGDTLGLTPKECWKLAIKSLGACIWYLKDCFIDTELLTMKNFEVFVPIDLAQAKQKAPVRENFFCGKQHMILDGITIKNLDILQNSRGTLEGTLLATLDYCCSPTGKRLLRQWICSPLCNSSAIDDRLDAIDDLMKVSDVMTETRELLRKLPDLERLLRNIHARGCNFKGRNHPDSRAIFYEDAIYGKRKILDFLALLKGFETAQEIVENFSKYSKSFKSKLLKQYVAFENDSGKFPVLAKSLEYFQNAFDHEKAKKSGRIIPSKGVDPEYDAIVRQLDETNQKLQTYLEDQCRHFNCKVTYFGTARNRFQLEVPDKFIKNATSEHELQGQRKGFKRYWTPEIKEMFAAVVVAEDRRDAALRDIMRKIFASFAKDYDKWDCAIQCLAALDVLLSLTYYSEFGENSMCRPTVIMPNQVSKPFIEIRNGCHPCIKQVFTGGEFIPNDTLIGLPDDENSSANMLLVTGPNMGGKSTLMRQVGLIVIMAHVGCYVPAKKCRLTSVDRIFTRLGASDRIMQGESTFYVELSETASILHHSSEHSLVLMDELGRGTSTYDGIAIACSVVNHLARAIHCRALFSTHYHSLVGSFSKNLNCSPGHMACLVENENEDDPSQETITFLYKFIPGACPKSYGFNAAKLAGLTKDVIRLGHRKAKELEETVENNLIFRKLHREDSKNELIQLFSAIKV